MYRAFCIRDSSGMQQIAAHPFSSCTVALMGVGLPAAEEPPEWVHLLPTAQGRIETNDSRGPYFVSDAAALIAASFEGVTELPLDENHATDLTPGAPSPARGWITAMEARDDGIWGKVRWTRSGRELVADQAYRGISPVFLHSDDKTVRRILRASLVNNPNLRGLATLHQEGNVNFMQKLAEKLGLNAEATEDQIFAALPCKLPPALQGALPQMAAALGLDAGATAEAVLAAVKVAGRDAQTTVPALQAQVTELSAKLEAMQGDARKAAATAFVEDQIKLGRMGLNAQNSAEFIAMHMENPTRTEALVKGFALIPGRTHTEAPVIPAAAAQAEAGDLVAKAKALQAAELAKGISIDWPTAVRRAAEGTK